MTIETFRFPGSSNLASATYDSESQELQITFTSGDKYSYSAVPQGIVEGLRSAGSAGSYFHRQIRNRYAGVPA